MENLFREKIKNRGERLRDDDLIAIYRDTLGKYQQGKIFNLKGNNSKEQMAINW